MQKLQHSVYSLLFLVLAFSSLFFARDFLIPVAMAAIFSMLFIKLCGWFEKKGSSRGMAALYCVLIFIAAISLIVFLLSWQLSSLAENIDEMKQRLISFFNRARVWINESAGISLKAQEKMVKEQSESGSASAGSMAASFAASIFSMLVNTVLVLVYMYLFLVYRSHLKKFILKLVPRDEKNTTVNVVDEAGKVAQHYLSGLGAMIAVLWVMYGIGFSLVGVENAIFFAVLCGLLEIIPFIGNLTGTSITVLAVLAQGGSGKMVILVIATYLVVQFIQTYILEPLIVGEQVNINPLFTIMVLVLGEMLWGVPGMILAIPLLGIIKIICDHVPDLQPYGFLIGIENQKSKRTGVLDKIRNLFKR
ncbi:AI-2E family transporter [Pedobacter metabolipauper]|uniref:Putative PurR-regulated permease PerM n=1 Tax=Pedobacter metabolipauper TaxID=425513 RepID=A0A4R6T317_9SPHI|nr:AI-2E family transporter [Pedobacter metabolipauper]TDQ11930.1 putative PurR-regulated permease PerM [Pedobacter metabolipauper]